MSYAPCPNCDAAWSAPRVAGNESMRERVHAAGCPGDGPVSPPAGLGAWDASLDAAKSAIAGAKADAALFAEVCQPPYGVKPNGTKP